MSQPRALNLGVSNSGSISTPQAHERKLSALPVNAAGTGTASAASSSSSASTTSSSTTASKPAVPLHTPPSIEHAALQVIPRDAAILELLPRGDVNAAHKLATAGMAPEEVPVHLREKLALFEQSFSVLRFPQKTYSAVLLDTPTFKETFHVDTISSSILSAVGGGGGQNTHSHPLMRTQKSLDLQTSDESEKIQKMKSTTVQDVFESLGIEEHVGRTRSTGDHSSSPPLPPGFQGIGGVKTHGEDRAAVENENEKEEPAVVLRSYFPAYDWNTGAEMALCERIPLPIPTRAASPCIRFLLYCKALQLTFATAPNGREIEPLFCELALYNTSPDSRMKLSDTFSVELSNHQVVKMLETNRAAKNQSTTGGGGTNGGSTNNGGSSTPSKSSSSSHHHSSSMAHVPYNAASSSSTATIPSPFIPAGYVNSTSHSPCTKAMFSLPIHSSAVQQNKSSIALVLLVYKVLQGKLESVLDTYSKGVDVKEKEVKSSEAKALDACRRWGEHRQLMMWSAVPVFNEVGAVVLNDFKELYRTPKPEESFTLQSLCDASATLLGKKKNPSGYKVIPGSFLCSTTTLPISRAAAIMECERIAPVYNGSMIPARMEEVVETVETLNVGHEMLAAQAAATQEQAKLQQMQMSIAEDGVGMQPVSSPRGAGKKMGIPAAGAKAGATTTAGKTTTTTTSSSSSSSSKLGLTPSSTVSPADTEDDMLRRLAAADQSSASGQTVSTLTVDEWVEVDSHTGALVTKKKEKDDAKKGNSLTVADDSSSAAAAARSLRLDHTRPRAYALPPTAASLTPAGFIFEVEPVGELGLHTPGSGLNSAGGPTTGSGLVTAQSTRESIGSGSPNAVMAPELDISSPFHLHYTHHLYVYPQSISFSDARNVVVSVQIKDTHESIYEPGLQLIYPRSDELLNGVHYAGTPQGRTSAGKTLGTFVRQTFTAATYHCYNANFLDEIKIALPLVLKPSHHLLFTFYNISCKDTIVQSKDGHGDDRTLLGYSMLPIYLDNRICDESYTLPVCSKLRPHYLLQKDEWENRRSPLFNVKLRLNSSLYTNDPYLNRFFLFCKIPQSVRELTDPISPGSPGSTSSDSSDEMLSLMLRKTLRSGLLRKKGGLKWTDRWYQLSDTHLVVYKSQRESKVWHHTPITNRTQTIRNASKADDELRYAWTIRSDGTGPATSPSELIVDVASPGSSPMAPTPGGDASGGRMSPSPNGDDPSASPHSTNHPSYPASSGAAGSNALSPPPSQPALRLSVASSGRPASSANNTSVPGVVFTPGLDEQTYDPEMAILADSEDEMFSWLKAIAHAKIAKWNMIDSIRGVKESQGELLIKYLPMIFRQLLAVICSPDMTQDEGSSSNLSSSSTASSSSDYKLTPLRLAAFETMLEVAALVEQGTPAPTDKQRNVHLDSWTQYLFDDNSSALPLFVNTVNQNATNTIGGAGQQTRGAGLTISTTLAPASTSTTSTAAAPSSSPVPTGSPAGPTVTLHLPPGMDTMFGSSPGVTPDLTPDRVTITEKESSGKSDNGGVTTAASAAATATASNIPIPAPISTTSSSTSTAAPAIPPRPAARQRVRTYEALASFWLSLLKNGGGFFSSSSSTSSSSGYSTTSGGSTSRTLPPLREHAARFSWFLLDMITKSLLLSTAGHKERRVSMSINNVGNGPNGAAAGAAGSSANGGINSSPFGAFHRPSSSSSFGSGGFQPNFFKASTIKLLSDLVTALVHEIFFLASISLSLSKTLNKNLALFLRDSFYIFPKTVVFDWISLYLMVSFKLEPTQSRGLGLNSQNSIGGGVTAALAGTSGPGASSSRFKYTALQIIADHEHYVSYNIRIAPFVGESKKYLQSSEFGEWSMGDFMNQPDGMGTSNAGVTSPTSPTPTAAAAGGEKGQHRSQPSSMGVDSSSSERPSDLLRSPSRLPNNNSNSSVDLTPDQLHPMREAVAQSPGGITPSSAASRLRFNTSQPSNPPAGHFMPFVLIKQVWLAFRLGSNLNSTTSSSASSMSSNPSVSTISIAQEQALSQAAYTLRSVLLKHEMDVRYQGTKKRSIVASMYVRILPCLWGNLEKLREMRTPIPGAPASATTTASSSSSSSSSSAASQPGPADKLSMSSSSARKDLIACALYVLNNLSTTELLRHLRESEYRIHTSNIKSWYFQFVELLSIILETVEYSGPLMRRFEILAPYGGLVSQLSTTLCTRMLTPSNNISSSGEPSPLTDWGGAEEIAGGNRIGGAGGGLSSLENKYTRNRTNMQLQGHRKSIASTGTQVGTLRRKDVQMTSTLQAADRARARIQHRTLTTKNVNMVNDGGDTQFHAITGIDPCIQRWEKLYAHESSGIVLHIVSTVLLPLTQDRLIQEYDMQDRLLWFLHGFLKLNQSDQMLVKWFRLLSTLLQQHEALVWPLGFKHLDSRRCSAWLYELLRHLSFHSLATRTSSSNFIYQLFLSCYKFTGSTTRIVHPLIKSFARVMDTLRNRRSEEGKFSNPGNDPNGWTILQTIMRDAPALNDASYLNVLTSLSKSSQLLSQRASSDAQRRELSLVGCIQDIEATFLLFQKIIETSALIHSVRAKDLDPDTLIEHCSTMIKLYHNAPRQRLLYMKHMYELHETQKNLAEAGAVQLRMFKLIHKESIRQKIQRQGIMNASSHLFATIPLWNSEHAVACLRKASELFEAAELYEQALLCENLAIAHWVARKQSPQVVSHTKRIVILWEKLSSLATLGDTRSFGTFYRVGFYGQQFALLGMDGKEWIYREPNLIKLPEITSRLIGLWSTILGREVTVFKDSSVIDRASLEQSGEIAKLQITAVLPYFESDSSEKPPSVPQQSLVNPPTVYQLNTDTILDNTNEPISRETHYEKNTGLRRFYYDTPYTLQGKSHGTVETQYKKRTLISLSQRDSFPSFLRRLPVASRVEIDMTPLECVLEDVHKRTHKLVSEARPALGLPDIKTLTQVLSGSVNVQVNGGTAEVCQVFLATENRSKWNPAQLDELRLALAGFVKASGEALRVAMQLAAQGSSENKAFIEVLEQGFTALCNSVRQAAPDLNIV